MTIVLEVSAAFSLVTDAPNAQKLSEYLAGVDEVLAPAIFISEAANTAWKFNYIKDLPLEEVEWMAQNVIDLIDLFIPGEELWEGALKMACEIEHPVYDCFYLSLAKEKQAILATLDKRLKKAAQQIGIGLLEI